MKKFDLTILTLGILLLALVIMGAFTATGTHDSTVATVNGTTVTQQQLYETLKEKYGEKVLASMTTDILIDQQAKSTGITVSDQDVQAELSKLKEKIGTDDAFKMYLNRRNLTVESLTAKLKQLMIVQKLNEQYNKQHGTKLDPNGYVAEIRKEAKIDIPDPSLQKK